MLIYSLHVDYFRGIRHLDLEKLTKVNLLLGRNNVAKTTVLEALYLFTASNVEVWASRVEEERGLLRNEQGFSHLFYGFNTHHPVHLSANINLGHDSNQQLDIYQQKSYTLDISIEATEQTISESRWLFQSHLSATKSPNKDLMIDGVDQIQFTVHSTEEPTRKPRKVKLNRNNIAFRRGSVGRSSSSRSNSQNDFGQWLSTKMSFPDLYARIERLIVTKQVGRLVDVLRRIDSRIESITLGRDDTIYFDLGRHLPTLLPLNLMGDGIQRLLAIVAAVAIMPGSVVLIDEIDNGLHYSTLQVLWQGVLAAAQEYGVQIVATTHSAEALKHLTNVLDDEQWADYRPDVAAYTLIRTDDDTVRSYRYDYAQLDFALEHDVEVRN